MNTGQIIKTKDAPFAMIPTEFLRDNRISLKAKGLLSFLLSLPSDWVIYKTKLTDYFTDGKESINSAWLELEALGYIQSIRMVGEGGLSRGFNYIVYYEPLSTECGKPDIGKPDIGKTDIGKTDIRKPASTYIDITKKEITNKYLFSDFWNSYNKKVDKKQTEVVWNKMSDADQILAVEGMDNHKLGREPKYWKDPIRYLRDRRWEDEPLEQKQIKTQEYDRENTW